MNALTLRDQVFSDVHARSLKPVGYKKKGHWSIRDLGDVVHSFYLRASRFGHKDEAVFWLDVQVFSRDWHTLMFAPLPFIGPAEGKPSLLYESLGRMVNPPILDSFKMSSRADVTPIIDLICTAAETVALPLLRTCENYSGLLSYWQQKPEASDRFLISAGLHRLLGQDAEARKSIERAKELSPHQNHLMWLEQRERTLWQPAT